MKHGMRWLFDYLMNSISFIFFAYWRIKFLLSIFSCNCRFDFFLSVMTNNKTKCGIIYKKNCNTGRWWWTNDYEWPKHPAISRNISDNIIITISRCKYVKLWNSFSEIVLMGYQNSGSKTGQQIQYLQIKFSKNSLAN